MHRITLSVLGALALAGCQTYSPRPLDGAAHLAQWSARTAEAISASPSTSEGLSLEDAEVLALAFNPQLRAARAQAAVSAAAAEHAGLWEDPVFSLDVMRVLESVPDRWVIGGMIGFTVPLSGRLPVEKALAGAEHEVELRRVAQAEWSMLARLRADWARWSAVRERIQLLESLIAHVGGIVSVVDQLVDAGELSRLEGRLFQIERASRTGEVLLLRAQAWQLELELKSLMGLLPEAEVALKPRIEMETVNMDFDDDAFSELERRSPELAVLRAAYEAAERSLELEIRRQYPDLEIGPAAESDQGQSKIGLGAGIPLPLLNANKQGIAAAGARREAARIEYEAAHERLVSELMVARSRAAAAFDATHWLRGELIPLAEAQLEDQRRLAELGELDVLVTLESVLRGFDTRQQLILARLAEAEANIRLTELGGPQLPESAEREQP